MSLCLHEYCLCYIYLYASYFVHVYILESPSFTTQPVSVTEEKSKNASFYVRVRGYSPFTYQWYHNSTIMVNEKKANLYINNLAVNNSGSYYCYICNPDRRCISSNTVYLTVTG